MTFGTTLTLQLTVKPDARNVTKKLVTRNTAIVRKHADDVTYTELKTFVVQA